MFQEFFELSLVIGVQEIEREKKSPVVHIHSWYHSIDSSHGTVVKETQLEFHLYRLPQPKEDGLRIETSCD